ncbi:M56 family metallopeptidase [Pseudoalteromonas sp. MMG005]|uniref:M56 family metallopeptidase n=1 Tax=Pseudoalteromonas sp. MMG005 TaxID=2822682 RepID=UPI001B3A0E31|nr:M56 family metallopeptidase [Pseudoalteromonas sp. MMG005]MBQ4847594.1 ankyrin repeat domain-containing protein [Pseudoalteromonas sp. MMG005]
MIAQYTLLTTLALHHVIIGSVLICILFILNKVLRSSAEMRSWVLMSAFITSTIVPITLLSTSSLFDNKIIDEHSTINADPNPITLLHNYDVTVPTSTHQSLWHMPSEIVFQFSTILTLLVCVWLVGCIWRSVSVLQSFIRTRRLLKTCQGIEHAHVCNLITNTRVKLYSSKQAASPMVVGLIKPKIIIPKNIVTQLSTEQLTPIILHELAHIQRNDIWFNYLQEFIAIAFWWSPVIRILNNRIHIDRELACDLRAVKQLNNDKQYAQSLIDCAKLMITQNRSILAMGLFNQKKELNNRVNAVLQSKKMKIPNIISILAVCFVVSASTIKVSQAFVPQVSISDTRQNALHYSLLPPTEGEQLIAAVMRNDITQIQHLQNQGVDINIPAIGDGTALIIAVKQNNEAMVQALIKLGANVDQSSNGDGNPLINAAMTNNLHLAQLLIDNGANINAVVRRDETPLINATRRGFFEMTRLLVSQGADVNLSVKTGMSDGNKIRSPLNMSRDQKITDYLIDQGAIK